MGCGASLATQQGGGQRRYTAPISVEMGCGASKPGGGQQLHTAVLRLCACEPATDEWVECQRVVSSLLPPLGQGGASGQAALYECQLERAVRGLCAAEWDSEAWAEQRAAVAALGGQSNTYCSEQRLECVRATPTAARRGSNALGQHLLQ